MADIVLISPRFEASYWGLEHAMPILGRKANQPPAALPLLAALTPVGHTVTLIDENIAPIDFERCARADIVGLTGMIVQRRRMLEILTELKRRGAFTVVGGPWVSVSEDYFGALADVLVVGEAEESWPRFLADWEVGRHAARYEQADRTDMSRVPVPRFDLLDMRQYVFGGVQFSRGCPFTCEFCDIIVMYGRRPRIKTVPQVLAELDALRRAGMEVVFIVDDNLIGNKKAIKEVLRGVVAWQRQHAFPLTFFTEASIDLAEDHELMRLMVEANVLHVFVGIETPSEAALRETRKLQNIRRGLSLLERVHAIQDAGLEVWSGVMVGFDSDDETIFETQRRFVADARIASSMIGMLTAIPTTPLHARLAAAGRLDPADHPAYGTNVIPARLGRAALRDGYRRLLTDLHEPVAFFARLDSLYLHGPLAREHGRAARLPAFSGRWFGEQLTLAGRAVGLLARLLVRVPEPALRRVYARQIWRVLRRKPMPTMLFVYALRAAMHYHGWRLARDMAAPDAKIVNAY